MASPRRDRRTRGSRRTSLAGEVVPVRPLDPAPAGRPMKAELEEVADVGLCSTSR